MSEQVGFRGLIKQLRKEGAQWMATIPQLPRLIHRALEANPSERLADIERAINRVERTQRFQTSVLIGLVGLLALVASGYLYLLFYYPF